MSIKIKSIDISGMRGVRNTLSLPLLGKSIVIYGDNGTGKSSISDSLEWFFYDEVSHLSGSEIDLKDALRNSHLRNTEEDSQVKIAFTKNILDSSKIISTKKSKLTTDFTNKASDFTSYINQSGNENLILRHQFLTEFVDQTKGDKLKSLSDVIGFSEVNKTKEVLKKGFNSIKYEIKSQNHEAQINTQKQVLIEKIGASVTNEKNLFEKLNEIIGSLNLPVVINSLEDIDEVLKLLSKPINTTVLNELRFLESCGTTISLLKSEIGLLNDEYQKYFSEFEKIASDVQGIMQIFVAELLKTGNHVIEKKYHKDNTCPLCLQSKDQNDLLKEIKARLLQIEEASKKKAAFDFAKQSITKIAEERIKRLEYLTTDPLYSSSNFDKVKNAIDSLLNKIRAYLKNGNEKVTSGNSIDNPEVLRLQTDDFEILDFITEKISEINSSQKKDNTAIIYSNISGSKDAFLRIKKFEREKRILEEQRESMERIYNEFVGKQKQSLQDFIDTFSKKIDEYYQVLNPNEQFGELRIATIGEDEELNGITIEFKYNGEWVSPPQKYFSESHLNCFGLAFFLASVAAFNKENKFIVLDDVISSFDSTHRIRFANLLVEEFSEYQIILLTHESEWFQYVSQLAKRKNWIISETKWNEVDGTHLEGKPTDLREIIESNLKAGNVEILGNPIRKYLEHTLKEICANLDVKVSFRYNEINEKRMPDELLSELKSKINKSSNDLKLQIPVIDRVMNSNIMGNLLSHDNPFSPKLGDLKTFWADIQNVEQIFHCQDTGCTKPKVSIKNLDTVAKKIRCGCDKTKYDWKN